MTKKQDPEKIPSDSRGRINQKKLLELIYGRSVDDRIKAVVSSNAQILAMNDTSKDPGTVLSALHSYKDQISKQSLELWYLLLFMAGSGCRVSEALAISSSDISTQGRVRLKGSKGSEERLIQNSELSDYFVKCKAASKSPFATFDRHFVYRYMKSKGLVAYFGNNNKASVTHVFRHLAILDMKEVDPSLEITKRIIGHKSIKSTEHYGNAKERRSSNKKGDN